MDTNIHIVATFNALTGFYLLFLILIVIIFSSPEGSSFSVRTAVSSKTSMSSNASIDAVFEGLGWTDYKSSALHMAAGRGDETFFVKRHGIMC